MMTGSNMIRTLRARLICWAGCVVIGVALAAPAQAERHVLVIGNSNYARTTDLPNPHNDAADMAARLSS